jgi:hypothetical protein
MIYIKYSFLAILQLLISLVSYPLAPFVSLFCNSDGNLPKWLSLFQTYDNTCDGDDGYKTEHRFFPSNSNGFQRWVNRTGWLWRNPAYGFDMLLGADCQVNDTLIISGDKATGDGPYHPGSCNWRLYRGTKLIAFQWYYVGNFSTTKCLRVNVGWKLWNAEELTKEGVITKETKCQLVFTPGINNKR